MCTYQFVKQVHDVLIIMLNKYMMCTYHYVKQVHDVYLSIC